MIIKKPSIFIYTNEPDAAALTEICAGIEEEGVFFELKEMETSNLDDLAWNAANDSMLGSGIAIKGKYAALQMRGLNKGRNIQSYQNPTKEQCRKLGANSARAIKKLAFK
ncbi:glycerol dehydratase reactivase beta/small subunit family protein [Muricomes intestini]|jgi:hypothetical protein|uniref:Dehydratase medium subunit n=1 Tax=Muricomes intestini TaxID=1796634 RepID=A0A4R3K7E1_9FIRM|nr:glycerol dehydratase reactivase beta/small subunit family protein [Muricomes intestini]TCS78800.1 dehydratase medium subunit [Muricomes intestini]HAX50747.1 glycerol dehydratase [Lachnospiraceae bacterium]HCR83655.1 glycerol dehydratase [Lachnospiraceae bacterium]